MYKRQAQVRILSEWNGTRPEVKSLPFLDHMDTIIRKEYRQSLYRPIHTGSNSIKYIEDILKKPTITDGRERFFSLVLCPYLINVKNLSIEAATKEIKQYFGKYLPDSDITYTLNKTANYKPYSLHKMKQDDTELYQIITAKVCLLYTSPSPRD